MQPLALGMPWNPSRPHMLVIACSDGRLQEATDQFLSRALGVRHYDRLYMPGGAGALASGGPDVMRAHQFRSDCRFLVEAHQVEHLILLFHGPAMDGPPEALCADYVRRLPGAKAAEVRAQQEEDVCDLVARRAEYAGDARLALYRLEVGADGTLSVVALHEDEPELADRLLARETDGEVRPLPSQHEDRSAETGLRR